MTESDLVDSNLDPVPGWKDFKNRCQVARLESGRFQKQNPSFALEKKKSLKFVSKNENKNSGGSKKRLSIKLTKFEDKTRWRRSS